MSKELFPNPLLEVCWEQSQTLVMEGDSCDGRLMLFLTVRDPWAPAQCSGIQQLHCLAAPEVSVAEQSLGNASFFSWDWSLM